MKRIVIYLDGGMIEGIAADEPTEVYLVDYDTEGADEGNPFMAKLNGDDCLLFPFEPRVNEHETLLVARTWQHT